MTTPTRPEIVSPATAPRAPDLSSASAVLADPHASKLSPDDPRLRLRRPASRTLRTGPIVVLVGCVLGAGMLAVAFALQSPSSPDKTHPGPSGGTAPPVVPDAIRNASAGPRTVSRPGPDAGLSRGEPVERAPRPEDIQHRADRERDLQAHGASILFETPAGAAEGDRAGEASRLPALMPMAPPSNGSPGAESDPNLRSARTHSWAVGATTSPTLSGRPSSIRRAPTSFRPERSCRRCSSPGSIAICQARSSGRSAKTSTTR